MEKPRDSELIHIIIIGAMKSGTSALFSYMAQHPAICPSVVKEPEFFSENFGAPEYKAGSYLDLFPLDTKLHKYTLEGSTGYTKYPSESGVPRRIHEYGLTPRFLYVVRNPFERIRSHYNFMIQDLNWNGHINSQHLVHVSNYYRQLEQYLKYFSRESILVLDFDELKKQPKAFLKKAYDHVGIADYRFPDISSVVNKTQPINRKELILRSKIQNVTSWIPAPVKKHMSKVVSSVFPKKQKRLTSSQKDAIYKELRADMLKFQAEYGFDVSKWGF